MKKIVRPSEKDMQVRGKSSSDIADMVYETLKSDYKKKLLKWILDVHWYGPIDVKMDTIDATNRKKWDASERHKTIKKMAKKMQEGINKPIILVNDPNDKKLRVIDGHTRFLARESIDGTYIQAYVAEIVDEDWKEMHDLLKDGEKGGDRK